MLLIQLCTHVPLDRVGSRTLWTDQWHWNRYPGARCDIPSLEYSYQFDEDLQQEWNWSEKYSAQPEILEYINHVADRFELRDGIQFNEEVIKAEFDEVNSRWKIKTSVSSYESRFVIFATGCLSVPNFL